jgi:hypothetical protein
VKRAALALVAALLLQMGCRTLPPGAVRLALDDPRPQALLAGWNARAGELRSLRGSARVSLDGVRGASFARQLLAVERPARLRVEVIGLLNQRIAVLATDGEHYDLYRSENGAVESGEIRPGVLWEVAGVPLTRGGGGAARRSSDATSWRDDQRRGRERRCSGALRDPGPRFLLAFP